MRPASRLDRSPEQLLGLMTVAEKVGQLSLYSAAVHWGGDPVNPALTFDPPEKRLAAIRAGEVTGIFNVHGEASVRALQRIAVEESRLGIPLVFAADVIHGFRTALPVPLAEAASFEPALAGRAAELAASEAAAAGIHWTFAPGADLCRDARWGRAVESYGEDTHLASLIAAARVRGFQGEDLADPRRLMATVKHFAGYGAAEAGLDYGSAEVSDATFAEAYLPPYRAAIDAGAGAVMTAFNDVGGVPCTASRDLLTGVLREGWGFEGVTVSDYNSDAETIVHGHAADRREAAKCCFLAGLDICMESGLYAEHLADLVASGEVPMALLDAAVLRVLRAKAALGLFDDPYRGLAVEQDAAALKTFAREAARRCPVLLKNEGGVLPLRPGVRAALIGPFADEHAHLNGAWAIFADNGESASLLDGFAASPEIAALSVAPGCGIESPIEGGIAAALAAAEGSDVVVLALGEGQHMSGESRSRADPSLPAAQLELARAMRSLGKPVVTLLRTGRPLAIPELAGLSDALLVTWFLGAETGHAIADLVLGRAAPGGRLPMSFPRHVGQLPLYYARKRTGRPPEAGKPRFTARYIDVEPGPLYPFGFGLGYGRADYGPVRLDHATMAWDGTLTARCTIRETAGAAIEEVAQLYLHDVAASRIRPVRELKGFAKLAIPANGEVEAVFEITRGLLAFADGTAEPGAFELWIAPHAEAGEPARFVLEPEA
ncbi:glycoside hydrolase family 3 N-terminal domain-containing protein [Sphingomonas sp.]|uniref:glycoside hydrolase family 3 N-terminal domain-containing protein n=1 Tax=Sphingomonas sp. TaxID=28214 RepID=UPI0025F4C618|nr:glycoside hydrolase family 3 N-terminal domain-containing protein [Sphingomonas sp.]